MSFPGACQMLRAGHQPSCVTRDEMGGTGRFRGALGRDVVLTQPPVGRLVPAVSRPWPAAKPKHPAIRKAFIFRQQKINILLSERSPQQQCSRAKRERGEEGDCLSLLVWLCWASLSGPGGIESLPEGQSCCGPTAYPKGGRTRTRVLKG